MTVLEKEDKCSETRTHTHPCFQPVGHEITTTDSHTDRYTAGSLNFLLLSLSLSLSLLKQHSSCMPSITWLTCVTLLLVFYTLHTQSLLPNFQTLSLAIRATFILHRPERGDIERNYNTCDNDFFKSQYHSLYTTTFVPYFLLYINTIILLDIYAALSVSNYQINLLLT